MNVRSRAQHVANQEKLAKKGYITDPFFFVARHINFNKQVGVIT
jgi:hypothetical protein